MIIFIGKQRGYECWLHLYLDIHLYYNLNIYPELFTCLNEL